MGITSFKSTTPSSESTSLCTRTDATVEDECKQSTTLSSTYVKKNFQTNTFRDGLKAWMNWYRHCVCDQEVIWSMHFQSIKRNRGIPVAFQWWRHGNRVILLAEKGTPKLHTDTSWRNIGFNHDWPCYVKNMAQGTQVDKTEAVGHGFCRHWGPRAMFLT